MNARVNASTRTAMRAAGRRPADHHVRRFTGRANKPPASRLSRSAALSFLLHLLVLAALIIGVERHHAQEFVPPAPIAMVFEHGGAARATAPHTTRHGPPLAPVLPRPPAAPPPPAAPGLSVRLPSAPEVQAFLQPPPLPRPAPLPPPPPAPARKPAAPPHTLYLPSLSFGRAPQHAPAVPSRGLNLALSQSELHRAYAPDFAIEGRIGPDWRALLSRWVDQRKYYPYSALEMGQQGSVEIRLVIDKSGKVDAVSLLQSSGSPFLDQAWLGLFRGAHVPPFPPGTTADRIIIRATMDYILIE